LDHEDIVDVHLPLVAARELLDAAVGAKDVVPPALPVTATGEAVGWHAPVAGKDRCRHRLQEPDLSDHAVAAAPLALAAAAPPDLEAVEADGKAPLQHLRVGEARVGHVNVHGAGAMEPVASAGATADRLVILIALVAEGEVVDRAL